MAIPKRIDELGSHMTPKQVALYMRDEGYTVGRKYETHGNVWDEREEVVQTGLLHLILDAIEDTQPQPSVLDAHQDWLIMWYPYVAKAIAEHEEQRRRLVAMFGDDAYLGPDATNFRDIHCFSMVYRTDPERHQNDLNELERKTKRMKKVLKPEHITRLHGIGEARASRILGKLQAKSES